MNLEMTSNLAWIFMWILAGMLVHRVARLVIGHFCRKDK